MKRARFPLDIATDPTTGSLDVSDLNGHVFQFSTTGSLIASFGSPGSGAGQFWSPQGVAVWSYGKIFGTIFIADTHNQRIEEWEGASPHLRQRIHAHRIPRNAPVNRTPWRSTRAATSGRRPVHDHILEFNSKHEYLVSSAQKAGAGQFKGIGGIAINAAGICMPRIRQQPRGAVRPLRDVATKALAPLPPAKASCSPPKPSRSTQAATSGS